MRKRSKNRSKRRTQRGGGWFNTDPSSQGYLDSLKEKSSELFGSITSSGDSGSYNLNPLNWFKSKPPSSYSPYTPTQTPTYSAPTPTTGGKRTKRRLNKKSKSRRR